MRDADVDPRARNVGNTISPLALSERLSFASCERGVIVLDCRSACEFDRSHIEGAFHVTVSALLLRRLQRGNLPVSSLLQNSNEKEHFNLRCKRDTIVVYDDGLDSSDLSLLPVPDSPISPCPLIGSPTPVFGSPGLMPSSPGPLAGLSMLQLMVKRLEDDNCDVLSLEGGYAAFQDEFPRFCTSSSPSQDSSIVGLHNLHISRPDEAPSSSPSAASGCDDGFPVQVLPYLFLGNASNSADLECLLRHGIRYILNVTQDVANTFEGQHNFRYMQIPITDHWSQNLSVFFTTAFEFVDEARESQCGVLIHCLAGISRSVTVTVAYIMQHLNLSLNDAYDVVKKSKPNISPNFNFMGQLKDFETMLNISRACQCQRSEDDKDEICVCKRTYFSSPTSTGSLSSVSSSSAPTTSSSASTFDYEVSATPS